MMAHSDRLNKEGGWQEKAVEFDIMQRPIKAM